MIPLSWKSCYDPEQDVLFCGHNFGFFSACCVSLWNVADLQRACGKFPGRIDFSQAFRAFRNPEQLQSKTDLYPLFFKPGNASRASAGRRLPHVAHHGLYRFLNYTRLNPVVERYFQPSDRACELRAELVRRYRIDPATTLAVVYLGTDKDTEIKVASPEAFLALTRELLIRHPGYRVWIQTDEIEVRKMFCRAFGERCFYLHEMPISTDGAVVHGQDDEASRMDRSEFGILLIAVNSLLAQVDVVVNHTGNFALWLCLFRGHARDVWQFDDEGRPANFARPACYWAALRRFMTKAIRKVRRALF